MAIPIYRLQPVSAPPSAAVLFPDSFAEDDIVEIVRSLSETLLAKGFQPGVPFRVGERQQQVARLQCRHSRCRHCQRQGLNYLPFRKGEEYRVVGECPGCRTQQEVEAYEGTERNRARVARTKTKSRPDVKPAAEDVKEPDPVVPALPATPMPDLRRLPLQPVDGLQRLLTVHDIAKLFQVSKRTIWRWLAEGRLPAPIRYSRSCLRWPQALIVKWLEGGGLGVNPAP